MEFLNLVALTMMSEDEAGLGCAIFLVTNDARVINLKTIFNSYVFVHRVMNLVKF